MKIPRSAGVQRSISPDTTVRPTTPDRSNAQARASTKDGNVGKDEQAHQDALRAVTGGRRPTPLEPTRGGRLEGPNAADAETIGRSPTFPGAAKALREALENPTTANRSVFVAAVERLRLELPEMRITEILFNCMKESIEETNEDKDYFLSKLKELSEKAEELSDYLSELSDHWSEVGGDPESEGGSGKTKDPRGAAAGNVATMSPAQLEAEIQKTRPSIAEHEANASQARSRLAQSDPNLIDRIVDDALHRPKE